MSKRLNLRLNVTEEERDTIRKAAALAGYRSMAEFCRSVVLFAAGIEVQTADKIAHPSVSPEQLKRQGV